MDAVSQKLEEVLHRLAFEEIKGDSPHSDSDPLLARLKVLGTEVWVDTGELEIFDVEQTPNSDGTVNIKLIIKPRNQSSSP